MRRLASVSVDLDPLRCYYQIHGLGPAPRELRDVVMQKCVPRFCELFARRGVRATFFVVGADVDPASSGGAAAAAMVRELQQAGHEIGNHSYAHLYDLGRAPRDVVAYEIGRAHAVLGDLVGRAAVGFRAPGYDVSADMLEILMAHGYHYDSSIFPAPGYYAAKAAVMGAMRLIGRRTGAVLADPRALLASPDPYRPDPRAPWRRGQATLVELPIAVTPYSRVPAIGTTFLVATPWLRRHWLELMRRRPFFNFELHGIDLADAAADCLPDALVARQPDLRRHLADKLAAIEQVLDTMPSPVPLRDVSAAVQREGMV
jgi:hypothetical protein